MMKLIAETYDTAGFLCLNRAVEKDVWYYSHLYNASANCCGVGDVGLFNKKKYAPQTRRFYDYTEKQEIVIPTGVPTKAEKLIIQEEINELTQLLIALYCVSHSLLIHTELVSTRGYTGRLEDPYSVNQVTAGEKAVEQLEKAGWYIINKFRGNYGNGLVMLGLNIKEKRQEGVQNALQGLQRAT